MFDDTPALRGANSGGRLAIGLPQLEHSRQVNDRFDVTCFGGFRDGEASVAPPARELHPPVHNLREGRCLPRPNNVTTYRELVPITHSTSNGDVRQSRREI